MQSKNFLFNAVKTGDLTTVKQLIESGADVNTSNAFNENLLFIAAHYGEIKIVHYLLSKNANLQQTNTGNMNALHTSCIRGHLEVVKILCEAGLDPHFLCGKPGLLKQQNNAITLTAKYNHLDILQYFLQKNIVTIDDCTQLYYQINRKNKDHITQLLEMILPINKNMDESNIQIIFQQMISGGLLTGMQYMLDKFPVIKNDFSIYFKYLLYSFSSDYHTYHYYFDTSNPLYSALPNEISDMEIYGNESLHFLLQHGLSVSDSDLNGQTLLHLAAKTVCDEYDNVYPIRALLDEGYAIDAVDHNGKTPLHIAIENGLFYHAICLIYWGADPTMKDKNNKSVEDKIYFFCEEDTDPNDESNQKFQKDLLTMIKLI
jgi:ankyrin repeat protein